MRLATIRYQGREEAGIVTGSGILLLRSVNERTGADWETGVLGLIETGQLKELTRWYDDGGHEEAERPEGILPWRTVQFAPLFRGPRRIFGIGLNYREHASELGDAAPLGLPGSFFKMPETMIGYGDAIRLPAMREATRTTAEAELGIILGRECRNVAEADWRDVIAGFTTVLDMTEEAFLTGNEYFRGNPRYLTISKNFPTFFSLGPELVTPDEVPDVLSLRVQSIRNGEIMAENTVANMTHRPARLIAVHSQIQGWYPGDILSTGTPGAFPLSEGDMAECRITGPEGFAMEPLRNPVIDLKKQP